MGDPASVSACVIARDDESHIRRCLASLAWTDECIVVLDDRSRDATEAIARACGARVQRHPYVGNVEQKNHALDQAKGEWVVALDADEALSGELIHSLASALESAGDIDGIRPYQDRIRPFFGVEPHCRTAVHQEFQHGVKLFLGAIAPVNGVRLKQCFGFINECQNLGVAGWHLGVAG